MRDSVSFWTVDDRGQIGLPRIGVEAVAAIGPTTKHRSTSPSPTAGCIASVQAAHPCRPSRLTVSPPCWWCRIGVPLRRAVRNLDHELRGQGSGDVVGGPRRRQD